MTRLHLLLGLCLVMLLGGCATSANDPLAPKTAGDIDLKRYQGKWYELARLPMPYQSECAQSEAHYNLKPDGSYGVLSRCRTMGDEWLRAEWVEFDNWFTRLVPGLTKGEYWILYVDDRYRTAIVGSPDRKYLWILSRTPTLPAWERESLLAKARQQGYDTSRLIWRMADKQIVQMH
jgi:apolipoprotein D and lipocalin family protein